MEFKEKLDSALRQAEIEVSTEQLEQFDIYYQLLLEWNKKINLTAITEENAVIEKHFLDSLIPLRFLSLPNTLSFADVGSGAGFPGIPWLIYQSDWRGVLMDSLNKRVLFLEEVLAQLGLQGKAIHVRGEEAGTDSEYREQFDLVTARAVSNLTALCEYTLPLTKKGGRFIALKGPDVDEEVKHANGIIGELGGKLDCVEKYTLPEGDGRSLVVVEKMRKTPDRYPRPTAQIKKAENKTKK